MKRTLAGRVDVSGTAWLLLIFGAAMFVLSGCAPLLIAGGAAGGYAVAKDMDDGELIDSQKGK